MGKARQRWQMRKDSEFMNEMHSEKPGLQDRAAPADPTYAQFLLLARQRNRADSGLLPFKDYP